MEPSPAQPEEKRDEKQTVLTSNKFFLFSAIFLLLLGLVVLAVALLKKRQAKLGQKLETQQAQNLITTEYGPTDFPLTKEYGSYHFFCVGGEIETQQPAMELPSGHKISHTIPCRYLDVKGEKQELHLPLYAYHRQELTAKNLGYVPEEKPPRKRLAYPGVRCFCYPGTPCYS